MFGLLQWAIFISLLVATIAAFGVVCYARSRSSEGTFSDHIASGLAMAFMFTLQLGTHANIDSRASRVIQLTVSMLTLVMFAHYTTGMRFYVVDNRLIELSTHEISILNLF